MMPVPPPAPKPTAARRRASSAAGSAVGHSGQSITCFLCEQPCHPGEPVKKWHGYTFHSTPCWNPVRSRQRICLKEPNGLRRELDKMANEPDEWRREAGEFDSTRPDTDRALARDRLSKSIHQYNDEIEREADLTISDTLKYTKRQYKDAAMKGMDSDEASADWDTKYAEAPTVNKKNEPCISLQGPEVVRSLTGTERQSVKRTADEADAMSSSGRGLAQQVASRTAAAACYSARVREGLAGKTPSLTAANLERHQQGVGSDVGSVHSVRTSQQQVDKGCARIPPKTFLQQKDAIDQALGSIIDELEGSRKEVGWIKKLESQHTRVQEKNISLADLPHDVPTVIGDLQRLSAACRAERTKIDNAKADEVQSLQEALERLQQQKSDLILQVCTLIEQLTHKFKKETSTSRSEYQRKRWKKDKMSTRLVKGGTTTAMAKWQAELITHAAEVAIAAESSSSFVVCEKVQVNPDDHSFDTAKMAVFTQDCPSDNQDQTLGASIRLLFDENFKTAVKHKVETMTTELKNHPQWPGALGRVSDCFAQGVEGISAFEAKEATTRGAECWLIGSRMDALRIHPSGVPMPGTPSIIYAESGPLIVHAMAMKEFLDIGIAVNDYTQHQTTPSGLDNIKKSSLCLLWSGDAVYMPAGSYWSVVAASSLIEEKPAPETAVESAPKAKGKAKASKTVQDDVFGMAVVVPIYSEKLFGELPMNVKVAVQAVNKEHFDSKTGRAMWRERAELFAKVFGPS